MFDRSELCAWMEQETKIDIPPISLDWYDDRRMSPQVELRVRQAIIPAIEHVVGRRIADLLLNQLHAAEEVGWL